VPKDLEYSGLEYAFMSGADVAPLEEQAVTELHKLFTWVHKSRKGVLLFIDEADAFLAVRNKSMSESLRNALTTMLYHTGTPTSQFLMVLATNRPGDLDPAVLDRIDESVEFGLPDLSEREKLVRQYMEMYVSRPLKIKLAPNRPALKSGNVNANGIPILTERELQADCDTETLNEVAKQLKTFSGREISKLFTGLQTHICAHMKGSSVRTKNLRLTKGTLLEVVKNKVEEHNRTLDVLAKGYEYVHREAGSSTGTGTNNGTFEGSISGTPGKGSGIMSRGGINETPVSLSRSMTNQLQFSGSKSGSKNAPPFLGHHGQHQNININIQQAAMAQQVCAEGTSAGSGNGNNLNGQSGSRDGTLIPPFPNALANASPSKSKEELYADIYGRATGMSTGSSNNGSFPNLEQNGSLNKSGSRVPSSPAGPGNRETGPAPSSEKGVANPAAVGAAAADTTPAGSGTSAPPNFFIGSPGATSETVDPHRSSVDGDKGCNLPAPTPTTTAGGTEPATEITHTTSACSPVTTVDAFVGMNTPNVTPMKSNASESKQSLDPAKIADVLTEVERRLGSDRDPNSELNANGTLRTQPNPVNPSSAKPETSGESGIGSAQNTSAMGGPPIQNRTESGRSKGGKGKRK